MPRRMVGLACVLAPLAAPFSEGLRLFQHAVRFGARCLDQKSVPFRRRQVSHRLMCLEDGLEHDLVEAVLLDLTVCFGLHHHCRRSAGSSVLLGSAGGSSKLPSVSLLLCAHSVPHGRPLARARIHFLRVACSVLAVEQAGHAGSLGSSGLGRASASGGHVRSTFASHQILVRKGCN